MALLKHDGNHVVFKHGKHQGDTLEEVCENDPGYVKWMFNNAADDLPDDLFRELESAMEEHGIEP